ncbi:MAG: SDR family NAD(P)-dependent oxidoreductase, partial [Candidatus Hodarchaeota archaeon]
MKTNLENKYILVTGASGGIGQTIAKKFSEEGCNLSLQNNKNNDTLLK